MVFFRRHPTGATILLFILMIGGLSAAPLPDWARPLDAFRHERPLEALANSIFRRAESGPRKGDVAAADFALTNDAELEEDDAPKPEQTIEATTSKPTREALDAPWTPPARPKLELYRERLHLVVAPIEESCASPPGPLDASCERSALDRFFARLTAARAREPEAVARVVHYGDSIIASDHITDIARLRLQERFGSGGKGFLLVSRYNARQRRLRSGEGKGWHADHIADGKLADDHFGYAGSAFTAERAGAFSELTDVGKSRFATVFFLSEPTGAPISLFADGREVTQIETASATVTAAFVEATLPDNTRTLRIVASKEGVRVYGIALEAHVPGVIYESIGVPGSTSEVWLLPEEKGFSAQLAARDPSLIVTMLGGNDARTMHQKKRTAADVEKSTRAFLSRLRAAAPGADCLIVSPLDGVQAKASGEMKSKVEIPQVIEIQRRVARAFGCGFWDMFASMGGPGALERWFKAGLVNEDLIHPRATGGDILGEMMAEALMNAYDASRAARAPLKREGERRTSTD